MCCAPVAHRARLGEARQTHQATQGGHSSANSTDGSKKRRFRLAITMPPQQHQQARRCLRQSACVACRRDALMREGSSFSSLSRASSSSDTSSTGSADCEADTFVSPSPPAVPSAGSGVAAVEQVASAPVPAAAAAERRRRAASCRRKSAVAAGGGPSWRRCCSGRPSAASHSSIARFCCATLRVHSSARVRVHERSTHHSYLALSTQVEFSLRLIRECVVAAMSQAVSDLVKGASEVTRPEVAEAWARRRQ